MYVEYCNYNRHIRSYEEELTKIFKAIEHDIKGFALPIHMVREVKEFIPDGFILATPIDYPLGYSSTKSRAHMALNAIQSGVNAIDYVPNHYYLYSKFTELEKEFKAMKAMCDDNGVSIRVFIDNIHIKNMQAVAKRFKKLGCEYVFPTLGYHATDFSNNLISCVDIQKKSKVSTIFSGNIWKEDQLDLTINVAKESKIFGIRLYSLKLWCNL